jgi:hypothetical protein
MPINVPNTPPAKIDAIIDYLNNLALRDRSAGGCPHAGFTALVTTPNALTLLSEVMTLANALKAAYTAHRIDTGAHVAADATNVVAAADATDQTSANTLLTELKTDLNAHMALAAAHYDLGGAGGPAAVAAVATANATDLATSIALANALKAAFNRHTFGRPTLVVVAS